MAAEPKTPEASKMVTLGEVVSTTDPSFIENEINSGAATPSTIPEAVQRQLDLVYPNLKLDLNAAKRVRQFIRNMRSGGSCGVILICAGEKCEYSAACPLFKEKVAPVGDSCPLEAMVIMDTRNDLSQILDLDQIKNPITRSYIAELTQIAVLMWRCQMKMAYDYHDIMQLVPAAVTPEGTVHTKPEMSPLIEVLDKLSARRSRLLKELAQTEEAKWRREAALGDKSKESLSRSLADRKKIIQGVQKFPDVIEPPSHVKLLSDGNPSPEKQ